MMIFLLVGWLNKEPISAGLFNSRGRHRPTQKYLHTKGIDLAGLCGSPNTFLPGPDGTRRAISCRRYHQTDQTKCVLVSCNMPGKVRVVGSFKSHANMIMLNYLVMLPNLVKIGAQISFYSLDPILTPYYSHFYPLRVHFSLNLTSDPFTLCQMLTLVPIS